MIFAIDNLLICLNEICFFKKLNISLQCDLIKERNNVLLNL